MIKAIIFDCFGVLYRGSLDYLYEITPEERHRELRDLTRASDYGYIDRSEFMQSVSRLSGLGEVEISEVMNSRHIRNQSLVDYLQTLKSDFKIGLLSNVGQGAMDQLFAPSEQEQLFDAVVLSSTIGAIKPSPAAYEAIAEALGVQPEECVMVDDMPSNVEGAERVGMRGVVFYSTEQFEREFADVVGVKN